ncbi:MAG TPA: glutathione synthase [Candidatus Binatia bacterium]|nr:glutathione synthase [Candidatus Binatia bacterium]
MSSRHLRIAFVMDPLPRIAIDKDTTFVFMLEAQARGHEVFYVAPGDLALVGGRPEALLHPATVRAQVGDHFTLGEARRAPLDEVDVVFLRKDPPFDMSFFFDTHVASMVDRRKTLVLNDPRGLREANEKLYALRFPTLIPPSLVASDIRRLKAFLADLGGEMIVKPLDGCGGAGVFHVHQRDRNLNSILEFATDDGRRRVMAQRYLPEVRTGDKRIILIDGEPQGAVLRVPSEEEHRSNLHVGGQAKETQLSERELEICRTLAPSLKEDGLVFVGLDVIGDWLTEVNVTSPTGVQEINALSGTKIESVMIDWVEAHAPEPAR